MENCDILKKSVLKKSDLPVIKKTKRVTFCGTVKVFIDELNCDWKNVKLQSNCVEVGIVDKSSEDFVNFTDVSNDDCSATDFLVHKVIYENSIEHEDDVDTDALSEDADEGSVLFETNTEDEGLHFVVHKVTDHEDDLIQQELDLEGNDMNASFSEEMKCDSEIIGKLSNLSIENILTHDKIIAFIDKNTLGLSSLLKSHLNASEVDALPLKCLHEENLNTVISPLKSSELVLSPPLQELSLDEIVKAQSGNALCELDISPLNSIQETDSDSDVSSEGTMIMMTTEESEKNEQHIRESFQKYESIKKEKVQMKDATIAEPEGNENKQNFFDKAHGKGDYFNSFIDASYKESLNDNSNIYSGFETDLKQATSVNESSTDDETEDRSELVKTLSYPLTQSTQTSSCDKDFYISHVRETKKAPLMHINDIHNSCYWDKSLESVQIPKDVREWKILLSSSDKGSKSNSSSDCSNLNSSASHKDEYLSIKLNMHSSERCELQKTSSKSDELESFVLASKERVQRIRKRYLDKAKIRTGNSPMRGIRPRFGSTAEIVQLMQKQNQHPFYSFSNRSHISWPCSTAISNSEINVQSRKQLSHMFGCQSLPDEYSLQSSFSSYASEDSSSSTCDHDSVSSCPSIFFQERGVPEGASPPQSLSEDSIEQCNNEENPNNIVYFSMKV